MLDFITPSGDVKVNHAWRQQPGFFDPVSLAATWDVWLSTCASKAHIEEVAQHRLQALLALARERSPLYRELYAGLPSTPRDLADLPVVTKRNLMAHLGGSM